MVPELQFRLAACGGGALARGAEGGRGLHCERPVRVAGPVPGRRKVAPAGRRSDGRCVTGSITSHLFRITWVIIQPVTSTEEVRPTLSLDPLLQLETSSDLPSLSSVIRNLPRYNGCGLRALERESVSKAWSYLLISRCSGQPDPRSARSKWGRQRCRQVVGLWDRGGYCR